MTHALILRPGALGDALLTLPSLSAVASRAERITVLGTPASWAFLDPRLARVRIEDFGSSSWLGLFAEGARLDAKAEAVLAETDLAILYLGSGAAAAERRLREAGIRRLIAAAPPRLGEPPEAALRHAAICLLAPLAAAGLAGDAEPVLAALSEDPLLSVSEAERAAALARLGPAAPPPGGLLALHPGSGGRAKRWPAERFAGLARWAEGRCGLRPLFLFGPADEEARAALAPLLAARPGWLALHGAPLREVLAVLSVARAFVGNDSGIAHLAARACPTLALFGPSEPAVWRPLGPAVTVVQAPGGRMEALALDPVVHALARLLAGRPS